MLERARKCAEKRRLNVDFRRMDAEHLDFPIGHFDTVVSTMALCTFIDPIAALEEMSRVCAPEGKILLMEHGRSRWEWLGRWQDRRAYQHAKQVGCHWNREPLELVQMAGLEVAYAQRYFFGVFHEMIILTGAP